MLIFHVDVKQGFILKTMIQSRLFLLRDDNFIHGALSDLKLCRMFSFTYTLHERSFSKIHNRGTLISSCLIVAFNRLELCDNTVTFCDDTNNQAVEIYSIVYIALRECTVYIYIYIYIYRERERERCAII